MRCSMKTELFFFAGSFLFVASAAVGGMFQQTEVVLPPSIEALMSRYEIQMVIADSNELIREAAVARYGQMEIPASVAESDLQEIFVREPRRFGRDAVPRVRRQVVRVMGNLKSNEAREVLEQWLRRYLEEGPIAKRYAWEDGEYLMMVDAIIDEIVRWKDVRTKQLLESIYVNANYFYGIREFAYYGLLTLKFHELEMRTPEQEMRYLAEVLETCGEEWVVGRNGVKTESGIRNGVVLWRLYQFGERALPVIESQLNKLSVGEERRMQALLRAKTLIMKRAEYLMVQEEKHRPQ